MYVCSMCVCVSVCGVVWCVCVSVVQCVWCVCGVVCVWNVVV